MLSDDLSDRRVATCMVGQVKEEKFDADRLKYNLKTRSKNGRII